MCVRDLVTVVRVSEGSYFNHIYRWYFVKILRPEFRRYQGKFQFKRGVRKEKFDSIETIKVSRTLLNHQVLKES